MADVSGVKDAAVAVNSLSLDDLERLTVKIRDAAERVLDDPDIKATNLVAAVNSLKALAVMYDGLEDRRKLLNVESNFYRGPRPGSLQHRVD